MFDYHKYLHSSLGYHLENRFSVLRDVNRVICHGLGETLLGLETLITMIELINLINLNSNDQLISFYATFDNF